MSVRSEIADHLSAAVPEEWDVVDHYDVPDNLDVDRPMLMLWRSVVRPGGSLGLRQHEVVVWVLVPTVDPETVDDDLDAALDAVLAIIDADALLTWTEAERSTLAEAFPGYRLTLTTQHRK